MTGSVEHYKCRRCGDAYSTDQALPSCNRGPCPMEPVDSTKHPLTLADGAALLLGEYKVTALGVAVGKGICAAGILSHDELIMLYNTMDGAAIIADKQPGDHGNAILEAYGRRVIEAAVKKAVAGGLL